MNSFVRLVNQPNAVELVMCYKCREIFILSALESPYSDYINECVNHNTDKRVYFGEKKTEKKSIKDIFNSLREYIDWLEKHEHYKDKKGIIDGYNMCFSAFKYDFQKEGWLNED